MNWLAFQTTVDIMSAVLAVLFWLFLIVLFGVYLHKDPPWDIPWEKEPRA